MSLSASAVTELKTAEDVYNLMDEWMRGYFDGGTHVVGNNPAVVFPKAALAYGQSEMKQPLSRAGEAEPKAEVEIRLVMMPELEEVDDMDSVLSAGRWVTSKVYLSFWVAAKKAGPGQSQLLAEHAAQLLKAILTNPDTRYALAEKGIRRLRPQMPKWLAGKDWAERLVGCNATVEFPVQFGDLAVSPTGGTETSLVAVLNEQVVQFTGPEPVVAADYLLGAYQWRRAVKLISATVVGWAPQGSPVVLGLEVNGVLTVHELVMPEGAANVEVTASVDLAALVVPTGQAVRWQVVSAPAPESSAWHLSVALTVGPG